jgi:hypothetical protein
LVSILNDEFTRLDEKRNKGQSIAKDLVEVYGNFFDSVYWPLVKAGHAPIPREGGHAGGDHATELINAFKMLDIQITQRK